jgi:hypothetical protein
MTVLGVFENIISDILFLLLAIISAWLWVRLTQRKKLIDFFGVSETKRLVIYLSNIRVLQFGSIGITGKKMSYQGETTTYGEIQAAHRIQRLFSFILPALAEASKDIGTFFLSDVTVQIQVSPIEKAQLDMQASIVTLGSPAYNAASIYAGECKENKVKFQFGISTKSELNARAYTYPPMSDDSASDPGNIRVPRTSGKFSMPMQENSVPEPGTISYPRPSGEYSSYTPIPVIQSPGAVEEQPKLSAIIVDKIPPITETNFGFIQRIRDDKNRSIFYIAGISEYATKGAAYFLSTDWLKLYKKYGKDKPFLVMLAIDLSDFSKCSVVFDIDNSF